MTILVRISAALVLSAALALPVQAEEKSEDKETVTSAISEPQPSETRMPLIEEASFSQGVTALVREKLGDGPDGESREATVHQAMRSFYTGTNAVPIWVDENGVLQKARDAGQEISDSGRYGMDPKAYDLPKDPDGKSREALAAYELAMTRAVLAFAHHAKAGRIHPSDVRHGENNPISLENPREYLETLRSSSNIATALTDLHPKHPQFVALTKKLAELRGGSDDAPKVQLEDGPALKAGVKHEQVALLRKRLGIDAGDKPKLFDDTVKKAVLDFQKKSGLKADGVVGNGTRRILNGESNEKQIVRILTNMERWRWLPDDLDGEAGIFVWANIPEYRVRIYKEGKLAFKERVIVGKTNKQTPVFSDEMEWIEIHPTWYVPMSIMVEDIGPSLRRPTSSVMERYHLQLNCGAHGRDWKKIDWNRVSIRNCSVSQPPGDKSVLGDFKFKFPNKHIVYMHDTPTKKLFNATVRTYSHGCVRIRNPRRMAEILLEHDKGMTSERMGQILKGPKRLHKEDLSKFVPVHMTYFTVFFNEEGVMQTFPDVYAHDRRLAEKLTGKGELLPAPAIAVSRKRRPPTRTRTAQDREWGNAFSAN